MRQRRRVLTEEDLAPARAIAARLRAAHPGEELAFVVADGRAYFARGQIRRGTARTPLADLIQGLYELEPARALRIVRGRFYATAPASELCWGMLKVAARKLTAPLEPREGALPPGLELVEVRAPAATDTLAGLQAPLPERATPEEAKRLARRIAELAPRAAVRHESDRPIAAVLVAADGRVLAAARNTNARNKTLHAEVNLVQRYCAAHGALPRGAVLYTTLKPCRMCAGMLWLAAEDPLALRVVYAEHDPGPNARATVLDARSPDRRRAAAADPALLSPQLEELAAF